MSPSMLKKYRLTLFGRSALLLGSELLINAACWIAAGILFGRDPATQPILSLALLAWTIGLRHALDADHISAIDNATRGLLALDRVSVTCGLFFSLGHSTIVIVVNVIIAISSDIYERLDNVSSVGGIVGTAVSASFLFIVGLANSIILFRVLRRRRTTRAALQNAGVKAADYDHEEDIKHSRTLMMRIIGPIVTFVDRPWKMYPVGVLFGFGFDTASSIALLAVSAIAKRGSDGQPIPSTHVIILPFLFTAGMTLVDSLDSILMLYAYADVDIRQPGAWNVFESKSSVLGVEFDDSVPSPAQGTIQYSGPSNGKEDERRAISNALPSLTRAATNHEEGLASEDADVVDPHKPNEAIKKTRQVDVERAPTTRITDREGGNAIIFHGNAGVTAEQRTISKRRTMSNLSIVLTFMSVFVAFSISIIEIMGLIGEQCTPCSAAAESDSSGLAGRWWRFWASANDNSGFIGAAIVGAFLALVGAWNIGRWLIRTRFKKLGSNLQRDAVQGQGRRVPEGEYREGEQ